jgi:serine O-acetyltransferase
MGILSKEDYFRYLEADRRALNKSTTRPKFFGDEVWTFERLLRKVEYYENCAGLVPFTRPSSA